MSKHGTAITGHLANFLGAGTTALTLIADQLGSERMQFWSQNGEKMQQAFLEALGDSAETEAVPEFKVWKTIKLGTGLKAADGFRQALKEGGFKIGDGANDILGQPAFTAAAEETEIDLVKVSVAELGFKDGAHRKDVYKRALELGLELCPAEVGPQLRLQYKDQPNGEWLLIAMEPIADSDGDPYVFPVVHVRAGFWLHADHGHPGSFWRGCHFWVFLRRK